MTSSIFELVIELTVENMYKRRESVVIVFVYSCRIRALIRFFETENSD